MSASNVIELPAARMLCDTPGCGHVEEVGPRDVRKHVGAQCPRCSAVMVTEETARQVEAMLAMVDLVNAAVGPVKGEGERALLSARIDRDGAVAEASFKRLGQP